MRVTDGSLQCSLPMPSFKQQRMATLLQDDNLNVPCVLVGDDFRGKMQVQYEFLVFHVSADQAQLM